MHSYIGFMRKLLLIITESRVSGAKVLGHSGG